MYEPQNNEWNEPQDEWQEMGPVSDPTPQQLLTAVAAGAVGAGIGALIWTGVAVGIGLQSGWIALGVGWLTGIGVKKGAEFADATNQLYQAPAPYQVMSVCLAFLSYVSAKLAIIAILVSGSVLGIFNIGMFGEYFSAFFGTLGFWDILWLGLMMWTAWSTPNMNED